MRSSEISNIVNFAAKENSKILIDFHGTCLFVEFCVLVWVLPFPVMTMVYFINALSIECIWRAFYYVLIEVNCSIRPIGWWMNMNFNPIWASTRFYKIRNIIKMKNKNRTKRSIFSLWWNCWNCRQCIVYILCIIGYSILVRPLRTLWLSNQHGYVLRYVICTLFIDQSTKWASNYFDSTKCGYTQRTP